MVNTYFPCVTLLIDWRRKVIHKVIDFMLEMRNVTEEWVPHPVTGTPPPPPLHINPSSTMVWALGMFSGDCWWRWHYGVFVYLLLCWTYVPEVMFHITFITICFSCFELFTLLLMVLAFWITRMQIERRSIHLRDATCECFICRVEISWRTRRLLRRCSVSLVWLYGGCGGGSVVPEGLLDIQWWRHPYRKAGLIPWVQRYDPRLWWPGL